MNTVFDTYSDLPDNVKGNLVVIGNFDGVHKGHQTILAKARTLANADNKAVVVLTFDPHPRQVFAPNAPSFRLTNKTLKAQDLKDHGVDFVVSIPFTKEFSQKTPAVFIDEVLINSLNAHHVVVGDDFIFGHDRAGSVIDLQKRSEFKTTALPQVTTQENAIYGSSLIRQALKKGDVQTAAQHLGRPWTSQGVVIHGDKRGREIGYPTANMRMDDFIHPAYGVYAVRAKTEGGNWINGVANFGIRPMFEVAEPLLEVHLFDFDGDLYDQTLTVAWVAYLRGEMKFNSLDDLITQIDSDAIQAKTALKN